MLLSCSNCKQPFNEDENCPTSLPCGHTFCISCIEALASHDHPSGGEECGRECLNKECPECAIPFASTSLRKNQELVRCLRRSLVAAGSVSSLHPALQTITERSNLPQSEAPLCEICDREPSAVVCTECSRNKSVCEGCFSYSHSDVSRRKHASVPWTPGLTNSLCSEHYGHECVIYCKRDKVPICILCKFGRHERHETAVMSEEVADSKQRVRDIVREVEALTRTVQTGAEAVSTRFEEITGRSPMMDDTSNQHNPGTRGCAVEVINRRFDELRDLLETRRHELIEQVRVLSDEKSALLTKQLDASSIYVAQNYAVCYDIKQTIENQSSAFVLEHEADMIAALDRQKELFDSVSLVPSTSSDIRFVEPGFDKSLIAELGSVLSVDVDPSRCRLVGKEHLCRKGIRAGETVDLTLELFDRRGERIRVGGDDVSCLITAASSGDVVEEAKIDVRDNNDGTYGIHCTVGIAGDYLLRIVVNRLPITGLWSKDVMCTSTGTSASIDEGIASATGDGAIASLADGSLLGFAVFDMPLGVPFSIDDNQLQHPRGVCYANGLVYVCDSGNHLIQVYNEDGTFARSIGNGYGSGEGQLNEPRGICYVEGLLYVCDSGNHRVQVFNKNGTLIRSIGKGKGTGAGQFRYPCGVCCFDGLLYISDSGNHRVQVFRECGMYVGHIGQGKGEGCGQMRNPSGLCYHQRVLYVCDKDNNRIQAFSLDGTFIKSLGLGWRRYAGPSGDGPNDICCSDGHLYVCYNNPRVRVFSSLADGGKFVRCLGKEDAYLPPEFRPQQGICLGPNGLIYVTDTGKHRVYGLRLLP